MTVSDEQLRKRRLQDAVMRKLRLDRRGRNYTIQKQLVFATIEAYEEAVKEEKYT